MLAAIMGKTTGAIQRVEKPKAAPALAYVPMALGSSLAAPVIRPGPSRRSTDLRRFDLCAASALRLIGCVFAVIVCCSVFPFTICLRPIVVCWRCPEGCTSVRAPSVRIRDSCRCGS